MAFSIRLTTEEKMLADSYAKLHRLICQIEDDRLIILALSVGHRREVYDKI